MDRRRQPVAIFWDFENCALHNRAGGWEVDNIRCIAHKYGVIKIFKAYLEISEQSSPKTLALRSELQSCGVSLTDCPHNGRKDVADKMILVDMLAFALDNESPATIILLSGDKDFVYALSILGLRKYHTVVIAPKHAHSNFKHRASEVLDWDALVVRKQDAPRGRRASDTAGILPHVDPLGRDRGSMSSPLSSTLLSPFLDTSRRSSFKDDRSPSSPSPLNPCVTSDQQHTTSRAPWAATSGKQSSPVKRTRVLFDTIPSESALDDTDDLLLSSEPGDLSRRSVSESSPFIDSATNLNTDGLCSDSEGSPQVPLTGPSKHAALNVQSSNTRQADTIGEPTTSTSRSAHAASAESVQPAPSKPEASPSQAVTLYVPRLCPTATSTLFKVPPAPDKLAQSQSTSLPGKPQGASNSSAAVLGSPEPCQTQEGAGTTNLAAKDSETVSASELDDARPFHSMIRLLDQARLAGTPQVLRGTLTLRLMEHNRDVFKEAGYTRFREYSLAAEKRGYVELGGMFGEAWISLRPRWHGCGQDV